MRRTRVYVSGPLSQGGTADQATRHRNLEAALSAGDALLAHGYAPLVPHLTLLWHERRPHPYEAWLEADLAWLPWADCLLALSGWRESPGARREVEAALCLGIPVYEALEELLEREPPTRRGDFEGVLREMLSLHARKSLGYGTDHDPYANVRASADWGLQPWVGAMVRATDKVRRLQSYVRRGEWDFESARDNLLDLAVYAVIALLLYEEARNDRCTKTS